MLLIEKGGIFMWPLLAVAVWALYLIIERTIYYFVVLLPLRRHLALIKDCETLPDEPGRSRLLRSMLRATSEKRMAQDLALQMAEKDLEDAEYGLPSLSVIAQSAPLLGLLGTVSGLIAAFIRIEALMGAVSPAELAGGIWEALITTVAGLSVAIPTYIAYNYFVNRVNNIVTEMEKSASRLLQLLSLREPVQ